jgi:glutamine synthetase
MTPKEVTEFVKKNKAELVDLRFSDVLGLWQHFTIPISELSEENLEEGYGFDGSSLGERRSKGREFCRFQRLDSSELM